MTVTAGRPLSTCPLTVVSGTIRHSADWKDYLEPAEKATAKRDQLPGSRQIDRQGGQPSSKKGLPETNEKYSVLHIANPGSRRKNRLMWVVSIKKRECMTEQRMVLIVDDEDICLSITSKMIEKIGLPVMTAHDGVEALEIYQRHGHEIGCVLLDIQMPRMNGIETFRRLKGIRENIQVVIASGFLYTANQGQIEPLGPAGYLKKPFTFDDLSAMVTKCLRAAGQAGLAEETAG